MSGAIYGLILVFVLALIAFTMLPTIMNEGATAKANANVTATQGTFIDFAGLFIIIAVALAAFGAIKIKGGGM